VSDFLYEPFTHQSEVLEDVESVITDLISNPQVIEFVRSRASYQSLEARLRDSNYSLHSLSRDVVSLSVSASQVQLIEEITHADVVDDLLSGADANLSKDEPGSNSHLWLRERISKENLEKFFKNLEASDYSQVEGIRLSFKRANDQTPGLRSLLTLNNYNNITGVKLPDVPKLSRRGSYGQVRSPPRRNAGSDSTENEAPAPSKQIASWFHDDRAGDALPSIFVMLATAILLATSMRKAGCMRVVDKLIQFTRKVTSWIVARWKVL